MSNVTDRRLMKSEMERTDVFPSCFLHQLKEIKFSRKDTFRDLSEHGSGANVVTRRTTDVKFALEE